MGILASKVIQNATTTVLTGKKMYTNNTDNLVISISGTSTSFTINFEGSLDGINFFGISGNKLSDIKTFSTTTSTLNEAWEFDVSALDSFRANITAISNGYVTVVGNTLA